MTTLTHPSRSDAYEAHKERNLRRINAMAEAGRDIGPIPEVAKPRRRSACKKDLRRFCLTYLKPTFFLPFCDDHLRVIAKLETVVMTGGQFAVAMPRSSGKSSMIESAALWALLYAHRRFVVIVGAEKPAAREMIDSLKVELEGNELLVLDFPEVCYPISRLEGIVHRCKGQTSQGHRTDIGWTADEIVLPTVSGSKASGSIVKVAGVEGRIRGLKHKLHGGATIRPDLALVDDVQTDSTAHSPSQTEWREGIVQGTVLGLAGPKKKIACLMPCTVIAPGDLTDRFLSRELHPDWNGERTQMLYGEPADPKLWDRYATVRAEAGQAAGTAFYLLNREALDAGLQAAWSERYNDDQASAIQCAMDLKFDKPDVFMAEYQNRPNPPRHAELTALQAAQVLARLNGHDRGVCPAASNRLVAFVDVQADLLYWAACAFRDDFTGAVVDYGSWPEQPRPYYLLRGADPTVAKATGITSLEGSLYAALDALCGQLLGRGFPVDGSEGMLAIERVLVDANWGASTDTVYRFCRESRYRALLTPSHGKYIGASTQPMDEWGKKEGERRGLNWVLRPGRGGVRHLVYDSNAWKSFLAARLRANMGEKGALTLFGHTGEGGRVPQTHRLLADHLTAEYVVRTRGRGRELDEWKERPEKPDNHFLDVLSGACVAASFQGCALAEAAREPPRKPKVNWARFKAASLQAAGRPR